MLDLDETGLCQCYLLIQLLSVTLVLFLNPRCYFGFQSGKTILVPGGMLMFLLLLVLELDEGWRVRGKGMLPVNAI